MAGPITGIDASGLYAELQRLAAEARGADRVAEAGAEKGAADTGTAGFAQLLAASIDRVNETQQAATLAADALERGDSGVTLPEVMIALQKANLSFQAMTEVRNRLVSAYQEIMSMPV
jgi:flagellar hook-basal body complex protein FliE